MSHLRGEKKSSFRPISPLGANSACTDKVLSMFEARNPKFECRNKFKTRIANVQNLADAATFSPLVLVFLILDLFGISCLGLRISFSQKRHKPSFRSSACEKA